MGGCLSKSEGITERQPQAGSKPTQSKIFRINQKLIVNKVILRPELSKQTILPSSNPKMASQIKQVQGESIQVKVPKDTNNWTEFEWNHQHRYIIPVSISQMPLQQIRHRSFQEKIVWFRAHLDKKRVSWSQTKSQQLQVDRQNLLMSSHKQFGNIDFYKQVKIVFLGQENTNDAGGVLRQWLSSCINQIFSPQLKLLSQCQTTGTFYKFNYNQLVQQLFLMAASILGVVIGKAIFERIPLNCYLNYTILRQLGGRPLQFNDLYSYDKDFYNSWNYLLNHKGSASAIMQNFCVYEFDEQGNQSITQLKDGGMEVILNQNNKEQYIALLFQHYCIKSISKCIESLKQALHKIIPENLLSIFEPHQLDMLMNGRQNIDPLDLKANTTYTGFTAENQVVKWFWEYVLKLNQQQLANLLLFVTGNSRVPILGFKYLQSNRGDYQLFHIKKATYDASNPYPKSFTCFNRLQLPLYPTRQLFEKYIVYVSHQNQHFGLD